MWNKHQDSCILEDNEQVLELEVKHCRAQSINIQRSILNKNQYKIT